MAFLILHKHDEVESFALNLPVFSGLVFSIPLRVALFMIFVSLEKTGSTWVFPVIQGGSHSISEWIHDAQVVGISKGGGGQHVGIPCHPRKLPLILSQ